MSGSIRAYHRILPLRLTVLLLVTGCSNQINPVTSQVIPTPNSPGTPTLPHDTTTVPGVPPDTTVRIDSSRTLPDSTVIPRDTLVTRHDTTVVITDTLPPAPPRALPVVTQVIVTPTANTMEAGTSQTIHAVATMSDGSSSEPGVISWSATGGTIARDGRFSAGSTPLSALVTGTVGGVSGSATVGIVMPPPSVTYAALSATSTEAFINSIGINVHISYFDTPYGALWNSMIRPDLLDLGVRHLRDGGTVLGDDNWMQDVYGRMNDLAGQGIKFDLVMRPVVGGQDYSSMAHLARLLSFAAPAVESFEGLNEHDLTGRSAWAAETRSFQAALYASVRGDPRSASLPVFGPSMGRPSSAAAIGDLSAFLDKGNIHPYPGGNPPLSNLLAHENQTRILSGGHPWMVTETGYHNALASNSDHRPVSEEAAARYVPKLFLDNFAAGIERSYLYELIDEGSDRSNQEQNFGLLRSDGSPKPAYQSLRNLISLLSDNRQLFGAAPLSANITSDAGVIRSLVLAKRDGRYYLVFWQDGSSFDLGSQQLLNSAPRAVTIALPGNPLLRVFEPLQSAQPISGEHRAGSLTIAVGDGPVIVEISQ